MDIMELNSCPSTYSKNRISPVKLYSMSYTPDKCDETLAPIIFIPGFFSTNRTFTHVRYKVAKRTQRKCYVIELRNHGLSEYSDEFTLPHCIADLENFMESNSISRAVLAGHSMGGRLALAMALKHPDMIEKVIVEDVNVISTKHALAEYKKNMLFMKFLDLKFKQLPETATENEAQRLLLPHVAKFWPTAIQNFSKMSTKFRVPLRETPSGKLDWEFNGDVVLGAHEHLDKFDTDLSSNPVYKGDTLLLAGELSITGVQNDLDIFNKHFPNLTCKIIPNAFHTYHIECADMYVTLVSKFLGEVKDV